MRPKGDFKSRLMPGFKTPSAAARFSPKPKDTQGFFEDFDAAELYCPQCGQAVPVIKRLFLILPEGDRYEYRCRFCGTTVGTKIERSGRPNILVK
jgi:DNA-directed RNA polymerase subunit RPC12/RpoP